MRFRSSADRPVLVEAAFLLPLVSLGLRTIGLVRVQRLLGRTSSEPTRRSEDEARRVAALFEAVARHGPIHYNCLQRSVALHRMLRRRGLEADIRIGVRREAGDRQFHAWVEHGGRVLNDVQHLNETFSVFGGAVIAEEDFR